MPINPLELAKSSAVSDGITSDTGEVEHFSSSTPFDAISVSSTTRQLAHRDNLLNSKLNDVINLINNNEHPIVLPLIRTTLPPGTSETSLNYRIPVGFEARVLNVSVSTTPAGLGKVEIFHNAGVFGHTDGTSILATTSEYSDGTSFRQDGEFVVKVTNIGSTSGEITGSVLVSMRPTGIQVGSLLTAGPAAGTTIVLASASAKGDQGNKGDPGPPGSGVTAKGIYDPSATYYANDLIAYRPDGTVGYSTWRATTVSVPAGQTPPSVGTSNAYWTIFAQAGINGFSGTNGSIGATGTNGTNGTNGYSGTNGFNGTNGPPGAAGQGINYYSVSSVGSISTDMPAFSSALGLYEAFPVNRNQTLPFDVQYSALHIPNATLNRLALIKANMFWNFCGTASVVLPQGGNSTANWRVSDVVGGVGFGGPMYSSPVVFPCIYPINGSNYIVVVPGTNPMPINVNFSGFLAT